MQRKLLGLFLVSIFVFAAMGVAFAQGDGNARKGKYLYRKHCRSCHGETASDLSPASKVQADWKAIFADTSTIPCNKDWPSVSDQDINDIYTYLYDFAKDSPSPAKCS